MIIAVKIMLIVSIILTFYGFSLILIESPTFQKCFNYIFHGGRHGAFVAVVLFLTIGQVCGFFGVMIGASIVLIAEKLS